jgi:hypothetical protein
LATEISTLPVLLTVAPAVDVLAVANLAGAISAQLLSEMFGAAACG